MEGKRVVGGKETKHDAGGWKSQHPETNERNRTAVN